MANVKSAWDIKVKADTKSATTALKNLGKAAKTNAEQLKKVGQGMKSVGQSIMPISLALTAVGVASMKFAMDLNEGMANVATLIPGNTERILELKEGIQDLAIAHGKATNDLVGGLYQTISAFGDTADTAKILEINSMAATAGMATTLEAINLTSAVTKGYGDTTAEAVQKASDLAFITVKLGQTTFPELASSIGMVVPLASKLGVEQEELFGVMATLTGVTGNASEVSTQFAAILRAMLKPTKDMQAGIKELGFASAEAMLSELGMVGALEKLIGTTDGSTEATAKLFGRAEALTAVFALTGAQADAFKEKLAAMGGAAGATAEAFGEQTGGINAAGFALKQFKIELTVILQKMGDELLPLMNDELLPALKDLSAWVMDAVKAFAALTSEEKKFYIKMVALLAILPLVTIAVGQLAIAVSGLAKAIPLAVTWSGKLVTGLKLIPAAGAGAAAGIAVAGSGIMVMIAKTKPEIVEHMNLIDKWALRLSWLARAWWETKDHLETMPEYVNEVDNSVENLIPTFETADDITKAFAESGGVLGKQLEYLKKPLDDVAGSGGSAEKAIETLGTKVIASSSGWISLTSAVLDYNVAMRDARESTDAGIEVIDTITPAVDRFNVGINQLTPGIKDVREKTDEAATSTLTWKDVTGELTMAMGSIGSALAVFGIDIDSVIGKITRLISTFEGLFSSITGIIGMLTGQGGGGGLGSLIGGLFGGGGGVAGAAGQAAGAAGTAGGVAGAGGGIAGAVSSGASAVMGGVSTALAAIPVAGWIALAGIGTFFALRAIFGGRDVAEEVGRDMGVTISEELIKSIEESGRPAQLAIAAIFEEGAMGIDRYAEEIGDLFSYFERGEITKPELITALEQSIPALIENLRELGPAGEEQLNRIISAAQAMGIQFEGLNELIQGTFAPDTLEEMMEAFGMTNAEVRELAKTLGVDIQTNLERMAQSVGLSTDEFKALGAAVEEKYGIPMDQIGALLASMGIDAGELATALGVEVAGGAKDLGTEMEDIPGDMTTSATQAGILADNLERASRAAGSIDVPSLPDSGGSIPTHAQHGFFSPSLPSDLTIRAHRGEAVNITPSGRSAGGSVFRDVYLNLHGTVFGTTDEIKVAVKEAMDDLMEFSPDDFVPRLTKVQARKG